MNNRLSNGRRNRRAFSPSVLLVAGFAVTILVGTVALLAPIMSADARLGLVDALFTATSAVCVTGLIVVDTGTHFSRAGEIVILLLVQIGGLGIFTFSTFFMLILTGETSLRSRMVIMETMTHFPYRNLFRLLRNIVMFTCGTEALGALSLWLALRGEYGDGEGLYLAVFHSVSAFCNAGFSLWPTSLEEYSHSVPVCVTMMILIVLGGLGFAVVSEVSGRLFGRRRGYRRVSLNTRIVLGTSATLICVGAIVFWLLEIGNVLNGRSPLEHVLVPVFQSVTARTAGFNTVPIARCTSATLFVLIALMFIGASPGSVGGGVKTTTFTIYVAIILAHLRGRENPELYGRTIPKQVSSKALATVATAFALVLVATLLVLAIEGQSSVGSPQFLDYLFEVVSAFGTVGLSTGVTSGLSTASKLVIIGTMFIGRVGPLGLALVLFGQETGQRYKYPEENVMIG